MARYRLARVGVFDTEQNAAVFPFTAGWNDYLHWLGSGNHPDPLPIVPVVVSPAEQAARAELTARDNVLAALRADSNVRALCTRTPQQVDQWIDDNATTLAAMRGLVKTLARVVALLARERL